MAGVTIAPKSILIFACLLFLVTCSKKESYKSQTHTVEIKDMKFQPAELKIHQGDTVIWINKDIVAHDVTEENKAWASPPLNADATWKKAITKSESYYCSIHVVMKGILIVEE